jgi:hypothetical protein
MPDLGGLDTSKGDLDTIRNRQRAPGQTSFYRPVELRQSDDSSPRIDGLSRETTVSSFVTVARVCVWVVRMVSFEPESPRLVTAVVVRLTG